MCRAILEKSCMRVRTVLNATLGSDVNNISALALAVKVVKQQSFMMTEFKSTPEALERILPMGILRT